MGERVGHVKRAVTTWVVGLLLLGSAHVAVAAGPTPATRLSRDLAELASAPVAAMAETEIEPGRISAWRPTVVGDWVTIDAVAAGDPSVLEAELVALGARDTAIAGRLVSARLPVAAISALEGVTPLQFARRALAMTNVGPATSQGDRVIRADSARTLFGVDGTGVLVGVLSDSFDCQGGAGTDVDSGDLPAGVTVLQDEPGCGSGTDEGRAMMQIVHDLAPGASLAYATAFTGQAGFANNIRALRDAGAKVIVDDVYYFAEPMFQDGVIAQAVDDVTATGVSYFSAAGNDARRSYDHTFVAGTPLGAGTFGPDFFGGTPHVFSGTTNIFQRVTMPGGTGFTLVLQWDSPFLSSGGAGTPNDLDIYLIQFGQVVRSATTDNLVSGDPVEIMLDVACTFGPCVMHIVIVHRAGPSPGRFKYVLLQASSGLGFSPALNSGAIHGHPNAQGAVAVGAAYYKTPTTPEPFSSAGTTPVLFDPAGNLLTPADPREFKPEVVAPDGVDTSFFFGSGDTDSTGFPNFFGTSAAAPHAAGVAALLLHALPSMTPADVRETLQSTAQNMGPAGFDTTTGYGLIRADAALRALHSFNITSEPTGTPNPVNPSGTMNVSVAADDTFGHALTYAWTATCRGGLPPGSFDDASAPAATWTAPLNATGRSKTCALKITVTDGHGLTRTSAYTATVLSVPKITSLSPGAATVGASVVIRGMSLVGATVVTFNGPVTVPLPPTAVTATRLTVIVPSGALTGTLSVETPTGVGVSTKIFKVAPKITDFTPSTAVGGSATVIAVTGTNLVTTGTQRVKIGNFVVPPESIIVNTPTMLQFTVPLGAKTGKIGVTTVDGKTLSANVLTVVPSP